MKTAKKLLCLVLVLVMAIGLVQMAAADFSDAKDIENDEAVQVLAAINVIEGYEDGSFGPEKTVTRAEAATIIARMLLKRSVADNLPTGSSGFTDVPSTHWASKYIAFCASQGIIVGRSATIFDPSAPVTAAEFAIMLMRALGIGDPSRWVGPNWAMFAIIDGMALGILTSDGDHTAPCTRDSAALFAFNALTKGEKETTTSTKYYVVTMGQGQIPAALAALTSTAYDTETAAIRAGANAGGTYLQNFIVVSETTTTEKSIGSIALDVYDLAKTTVDDAFGRPGINVWKQGTKTIVTVETTAALLSYTNTVRGSTIFADLGLTSPGGNLKDQVTYVDGAVASPTSLNSGTGNLARSGPGVLTEVYKVGNAYRIVFINTYVGSIKTVKAATATYDAYVVITADSGPDASATFDFETTDFKEKDVVIYTAAWDKDAGEFEVQTVDKVDSTTVVPTSRSATGFRAGGAAYTYSKNSVGTVSNADVTGKVEKNIYLDTYGYVIKAGDAYTGPALAPYAVLLAVRQNRGSGWNAEITYDYRLLLADGSTVEVPSGNTNADSDDYGLWNLGSVVEYTVANGKYKIVDVIIDASYNSITNPYGDLYTGYVEITRNALPGKLGGTGTNNVTFTRGTVFFVKTGNSYSVYNITKIPNIKSANGYGYAGAASAVEVVFIDTPRVAGGATASHILYVNKASVDTNADPFISEDGDEYYTYRAVLDGERVWLDISADESLDYIIYSSYDKSTEDIYSNIGDYADAVNDSGLVKYDGVAAGTVTFKNTTTLLINDDTLFFLVDDDGSITEIDAADLNDDLGAGVIYDYFSYYTVDNVLAAVFVVFE